MNTIYKKIIGFTLLELMVTISIASILLGMAAPSFNAIITSNKLTSYNNTLVGSINYARSEAVKRGVQVTIRSRLTVGDCPPTSNASPINAGGAWEGGWTVFVDNNRNGICDGTDIALKTYPALSNGYTLRIGSNFTCWLAYTSTGNSTGSGSACSGGTVSANDTFRLCDVSASTTLSRSVVINTIGRPSSTKGTSSCP